MLSIIYLEDFQNMKTRNSIIALLLALSMVIAFSFTACNNDDSGSPSTTTPADNNGDTTTPEINNNGESTPDPNAGEGNNTPGDDHQFGEDGMFELSVEPDEITDNGANWGWYSHGIDGKQNDRNLATFQNADYLVIEFDGEVDMSAFVRLSWNGHADGWVGWHEDNDFKVEDILSEDGDSFAISLNEYIANRGLFNATGDEYGIKLFFGYGPGLAKLDITAVYLKKTA